MHPHNRKDANLVPLLDFIQFVAQSNGDATDRSHLTRLPKRINGAKQMATDGAPTIETHSVDDRSVHSPSPPREDTEIHDTEETSDSPLPTPGLIGKRSRSSTEALSEDDVAELVDVPTVHEFVSESSKNAFTASYVDVPFTQFGVSLLLAADSTVKSKSLIGVECCYLKLGTSVVVTGRVADVDFVKKGRELCITPDRGVDASVEWVKADRVYELPKSAEVMQRLRQGVATEVKKAIFRVNSAPKV